MIDQLAHIRHILVERVEGRLAQVFFTRLILFLGQVGPIFVIRVGTRHDQTAIRTGARPRIVKRVRPAGDVAAQKQIGAEQRRGRAEKQIAAAFV